MRYFHVYTLIFLPKTKICMACESQRHMRVTQPPLGTLMWSGHVNNLNTVFKTSVSSSVYLRLLSHRSSRWIRLNLSPPPPVAAADSTHIINYP